MRLVEINHARVALLPQTEFDEALSAVASETHEITWVDLVVDRENMIRGFYLRGVPTFTEEDVAEAVAEFGTKVIEIPGPEEARA